MVIDVIVIIIVFVVVVVFVVAAAAVVVVVVVVVVCVCVFFCLFLCHSCAHTLKMMILKFVHTCKNLSSLRSMKVSNTLKSLRQSLLRKNPISSGKRFAPKDPLGIYAKPLSITDYQTHFHQDPYFCS